MGDYIALHTSPQPSPNLGEGEIKRIIKIIPFILIALLHAVGVFLPETGFDALWYHLPITRIILSMHSLAPVPEIYQSYLPHFGSLLFVVPYAIAGVFGVKIFVFLISFLIPFLTFKIARQFLPEPVAWLLALVVYTFHTVAWQSSSAYVDQIRTVFELGFVYFVTRSSWKSGVFLGLSLATKILAVFYLPIYILYVWIKKSWRDAMAMSIVALLFLLPWIFQSNFGIIFQIQNDLMGHENVLLAASRVFLAPWLLTTQTESYLTPLFLFAFPFVIIFGKKLWRLHRSECVLVILSLTLWFIIPPVSVRYALMPIILALILATKAVWLAGQNKKTIRLAFLCVAFAGMGINLSIRMVGAIRDLPYLSGRESEREYLARHDSPIIHEPLERWYSGYWEKYK